MINDTTIQTIRDAARIEDVVNEFVPLRRRGAGLVACCPFHNERTPSFNVSPARGIYKCFGCGAAGDVFNFLERHEGMSFAAAARWLAKRYGIAVEENTPDAIQTAAADEAEAIGIINQFAARYYAWKLQNAPGNADAQAYIKDRKIAAQSVERFAIGYAEGPDDLLHWLRKRAYAIPHAIRAGLCNSDATRDFFRRRLIFPIHSLSGKVVAFAGRTLPSGGDAGPKYLNSPETALYQKSKTLYGLYQARQAMRKQNQCIIVEGYMDVIALHQYGIEHVVASCGTALTPDQLRLIRRHTQSILMLYDGDAAGVSAAWRALDLALEQDLEVKGCLLPPGEDPDSFINRVGERAFREYLESHTGDMVVVKAETLCRQAGNDPTARARALHNLAQTLARIPDTLRRSIYTSDCAHRFQIDPAVLDDCISKTNVARLNRANHAAHTHEETDCAPNAAAVEENALIDFLLRYGALPLPEAPGYFLAYRIWTMLQASEAGSLANLFEDAAHSSIIALYSESIANNHPLQAVKLLQSNDCNIRERVRFALGDPSEWELPEPDGATPQLIEETERVVARFKVHKLNLLMEENRKKLLNCSPENVAEMERLIKVGMKIREARNEIAQSCSLLIVI